MKRQALFVSVFTTAMLALPAFAADGASGIFGLRWGKNVFNFEGMPSGPQPPANLSRRPDGTSNAGRLVGDYRNPILTPKAAAVVKQKGELAIAGVGFANAQDQCRAIAPPFSSAMTLAFVMLQKKNGDIAMISDNNANTRHIRMNGTHPANLKPRPMGDSIGRWEGDTLVIDTVGVKVDDFLSVDRFGTPLSEAMHIVERYRLIDYSAAKAALISFTKTLAKELAPTINVNVVAPGFVETENYVWMKPEVKEKMIQSTLIKRLISVDEIAEAFLYLAGADAVTGEVLLVDGGFTLKAN